jgi:hypothetical protein
VWRTVKGVFQAYRDPIDVSPTALRSAASMTDDAPRSPVPLVQEADVSERVVVLRVRVPGRTSFAIVGAAERASGAGLLEQGKRQATWGGRIPPGAARQKAREEALVGAELVALGAREAFIAQDGQPRVVRAERGRVVVTDAPLAGDAQLFLSLTDDERTTWEARGAAIAAALADDAIDLRRAEIAKLLERALSRIDRRRRAIAEDLAKIGQADVIAAQAQWLVAEAKRAPRGATKLVVTDWSSGEAVPLEIPLDPSKSAREQVEAMFKRAKRLRLGARIANDRLAEADRQREGVTRALAAVRVADTLAAIEEAAREAKKTAPRDVTLAPAASSSATPGTRAAAKDGGRVPYRTFLARSGRRLLVGKGAADNDALTLKTGRPHDLWVHAKDRTGAHVIVPLDRGKTAASEDLVDAAHLAAHFSDAREEKVVDVQYTDRRFLRKPKGSAPGFVVVDREKVIVLRVEPEILRALLEREDV